MEIQQLIVGFIFTIWGGLNAVRPGILIGWQVWFQQKVMGAQYTPSPRTFKAVQILGVIFIVLGLFMIVKSVM